MLSGHSLSLPLPNFYSLSYVIDNNTSNQDGLISHMSALRDLINNCVKTSFFYLCERILAKKKNSFNLQTYGNTTPNHCNIEALTLVNNSCCKTSEKSSTPCGDDHSSYKVSMAVQTDMGGLNNQLLLVERNTRDQELSLPPLAITPNTKVRQSVGSDNNMSSVETKVPPKHSSLPVSSKFKRERKKHNINKQKRQHNKTFIVKIENAKKASSGKVFEKQNIADMILH
ncbi:hypothetical protein RFI_28447 [Reticulomyxa filosa]|uniref:Uncharacterized protein n=1 Tax=Reticulomyxa filosa TaxID=46433 RepID=X6M5Q3_RETFI|nr:hypothetical protein RFI_28447 [Reticulomyxa filosa]|eukprot:ETO08941.1 hypothetical protein RFI_28447 [Reticulomyxa filosa]